MAAYWRVKKWNLTASVSGLTSGNFSCEIIVDKPQESDLVCYTQSSGGGSLFSASIQPDGIVVSLFVEYEKIDPFNPINPGGLVLCNGYFLWFPSTSGSNQVTVTLGTINKQMSADFVPSFLPGSVNDVSASVLMKAVEWWSYDGLYNTSTGQRI